MGTFVPVTSLLHGVLDGITEAETFADAVAAHAANHRWLTSLGTALRELGKMIDGGMGRAVARQGSLLATTAQQSHENKTALEKSKAEAEALRKEVDRLQQHNGELRSSLEFVAGFNEATAASRSPGESSEAERKLQAELRRVQLLREALEAEAKRMSSARSARLKVQRELHCKSDTAVEEETARVAAVHRETLKRLKDRFGEERHAHAKEHKAREESKSKTHRAFQQRVKQAEDGTKREALRADAAEAKASAAAEVLIESQAEAKKLADELARCKMQMQLMRAMGQSMGQSIESSFTCHTYDLLSPRDKLKVSTGPYT